MQLIKHGREEREALLTTAAPNGRYQLRSECQQPTDPTKILAQQGRSKYPAPATTPLAGQEHPLQKERREGPSTALTGAAEEEAPTEAARPESAGAEEALPPRGPGGGGTAKVGADDVCSGWGTSRDAHVGGSWGAGTEPGPDDTDGSIDGEGN
ncbi:unnamed protein product [Closterium sp. Naga37s-1]|nr:unnamed protein product [Closterium sp. Naga37s-1]